jgi:hypothetical protein
MKHMFIIFCSQSAIALYDSNLAPYDTNSVARLREVELGYNSKLISQILIPGEQ